MGQPYEKELKIAELAVQNAAILSRRIFDTKVKTQVSKEDRSPVTIADYASQAIIIKILKHFFPEDEIIGEEEASGLRKNNELKQEVWQLVSTTKLTSDNETGELPSVTSEDDMLQAIDSGNGQGGPTGRKWALDPIDGTKGFLRGGQYAVALALIVDGKVQVGVLGCPNLPISQSELSAGADGLDADVSRRGITLSAVRGQGCYEFPIDRNISAERRRVQTRSGIKPSDAILCESFDAKHSAHGQQAEISKELGITKPSVRIDSAAKYAVVARGTADIYLRLLGPKFYVPLIWDHAAGVIIVEEAGATVRDVHGKELDFGAGRRLSENEGFVICSSDLYPQVAAAVKRTGPNSSSI